MNLRQYSIAAAQPGLAVERIGNLSIPVPARPEQDRIAATILAEAEPINEVVERTRRAIHLVSEFRTRLIADVATGKMDVREAVAHLRDEVDEPELLDDADLLAEDDEPEVEEHLRAAVAEVGA